MPDTSEIVMEQIRELEAEVKTFRQTIRELKNRLVKICSHKKSTYYPDASGNNGSFYECAVCGQYSKHGFPDSQVLGR